MTKEEQKELLAVAHHLRQATVSLTQAHVHVCRALRVGESDHQRLCIEIRDLLNSVVVKADGVARKAGPIKSHPRFPCNRSDCPIHAKENTGV